ncbi:dephospho-CoA kinase [Thermus filiformis]|uniref:Dephospho-CoA kinase n=1 Tax=Thermus filiformis TaxID=276 RepID=A0A0A2WSF4_THEFI|nr:dephospho-CoA kinase [Thermus filiformis]KGQ22748.2 dephospho-CoA kinase [Thermus filiformis]
MERPDRAKHPPIMPLKVGITGSLGSGKSTVAALLRERGYPVLDADALAREGREVLREEICRAFPEACREGALDERALARLVFSDEEKLRLLEGLLHPYVRRRLEEEMARLREAWPGGGAKAPILFLEIPLLFEVGWEKALDRTLVVAAPLEARLERVRLRSGLSREEALAREARQLPQEEKVRRADYVLWNTGDLDRLRRAVEALLRVLESSP